MRLGAIVAASNLTEATAIRIVQELCALGMLVKNPRSRKISLGRLAFEFGLIAADDETACSEGWLGAIHELAIATRETVYLNQRNGFDSVCVNVAAGTQPVRAYPIDVGVRRPLGAGAGGIAILASLPEDEAHACIMHNTPTYSYYGLTSETVAAYVDRARECGYSLVKGLTIPGVTVFGVAIPHFVPELAISIAAMSSRFDEDSLREAVQLTRNQIEIAASDPLGL